MVRINTTPIYTIVVCTKLQELVYKKTEADGTVLKKPSGFIDYGERDEVGFFHEKENAFDAVKGNACDINETCYEYAIVEEVKPGIYSSTHNRWFFKYNRDRDEYVQIAAPQLFETPS